MCAAGAPVAGQWYAVNYNYIPAPAYGVAARNAALDVAYFLLTRAHVKEQREHREQNTTGAVGSSLDFVCLPARTPHVGVPRCANEIELTATH